MRSVLIHQNFKKIDYIQRGGVIASPLNEVIRLVNHLNLLGVDLYSLEAFWITAEYTKPEMKYDLEYEVLFGNKQDPSTKEWFKFVLKHLNNVPKGLFFEVNYSDKIQEKEILATWFLDPNWSPEVASIFEFRLEEVSNQLIKAQYITRKAKSISVKFPKGAKGLYKRVINEYSQLRLPVQKALAGLASIQLKEGDLESSWETNIQLFGISPKDQNQRRPVLGPERSLIQLIRLARTIRDEEKSLWVESIIHAVLINKEPYRPYRYMFLYEAALFYVSRKLTQRAIALAKVALMEHEHLRGEFYDLSLPDSHEIVVLQSIIKNNHGDRPYPMDKIEAE